MAIDDLLLKVKNRKLVVMLFPVVAGAILGGSLVVKPSLKRLKALQSDKAGLSQKENIYKDVVEQEKKLADYRQVMTAVGDKAKLIEELNALAGQSGLTLLSIAPDEKRIWMVYLERTDVRIETEGNYHQLGDFVSRVENMGRFAKILNVSINTEAKPEDVDGASAESASPRLRPAKDNAYRISLVVGLLAPVKDVF